MRPPITLRRWRRVEYDRLVDLEVFRSEPVELIGGHLVVAEPQGSRHAAALSKVDYTIRAAMPAGFIVRLQSPIALDDESEPEPDLAVVEGWPGDYRDAHPTRPVLIVEIAESSLEFDRAHKGSVYARAGVPDYWIVDVIDSVLEVRRGPQRDPTAAFGWSYETTVSFGAAATVTPVVLAGRSIRVADLLL